MKSEGTAHASRGVHPDSSTTSHAAAAHTSIRQTRLGNQGNSTSTTRGHYITLTSKKSHTARLTATAHGTAETSTAAKATYTRQ